MKIAHIVGARPQFIKYFPVSRAIEEHNKNSGTSIKEILIHTGQHYDYSMSKIFFDCFVIKEPDYHLGIGSGSHGEQTGQIIEKVEITLLKEKPDIVLLYGDTNSTLGGAIAAAKLHIPIVHIEAGLRSYNKAMPEEINRILTDHVSSMLVCPSESAVKNLQKEGLRRIINNGKLIDIKLNSSLFTINISKPIVVNVGDVMYDVLLHAVKVAEKKSDILKKLNVVSNDFYVLTLHRAENIDDKKKFEDIINFVSNISKNKKVIFPIHPRTKKFYQNSMVTLSNNIIITDPMGYFDILHLLKNSSLIMTDSGGMQKEAYWLKIPCITLREETEWVETVQNGYNVLYKDYKGDHRVKTKNTAQYGDGKAAERISKIICSAS